MPKMPDKKQVLLRLNATMINYCEKKAEELSFNNMQDYIKSLIREKLLKEIDKYKKGDKQ